MAKVMNVTLEGFEDPGFEVLSFRGEESISTPFRYVVTLGSKSPSQDFDGLLEAKAHLQLGSPAVNIRGLLSSIQQGYDGAWEPDAGTLTRFEVVLVPTLWALSLTTRTKIFQEMTVPDIVKKVLTDAGIAGDADWKISGAHPKHEFVLQYQETDLHFIHRLMEQEGIFYFFQHGEDAEKMILADSKAAFEDIPDDPVVRLGKPDPTIGETGVGSWGYEQTATRFQSRQGVVPGKVILKDYNFQKPKLDLLSEEPIKDAKALVGFQYEYGDHYLLPEEGKALRTLRAEEILARRRVFFGAGTVRRFYPGGRFSLTGLSEVDTELSQGYVITEMTSEGTQPVEHGSAEEGWSYENRFTCIPDKLEFRPERRTEWPRIAGVVHAKVCAASGGGQYAHMDDRGRYKVKFLFDIDHKEDDDKASCWMRLAEPYAGAAYGFHSPLLKGHEVLVAFENGDPHRPFIVGCVYNTDNPSPTTSANQAQHFWKSAGNNELRYDDTEGSEHVFLHGQKDWMIKIENDKSQNVGHDETMEIGNDRTKTIGHDQKVEIGNNKTTKVGADHQETVGANQTVSVGANQDITIGSNKTESVAVAATETVGAAKAVTVGAALQITVGAAMNETVGLAKAVEVGGSFSETVGGGRNENINKDKQVAVGGNLTESIKKNHSETVTEKYSLVVKDSLAIESQKDIVIKTGKASITMKKDGTIVIEGKDVQIKGSGEIVAQASKDMTLKGKNILQN